MRWLRAFFQSPEGKLWMPERPERFEVGGLNNSIVGADLASAATIAPDSLIHNVSGVAAIVNITVPWPGFCGMVILIPTGIFTWTNAGNIGLAGTAVVGKAIIMAYHPAAGKWYPSVIA